MESADKELVDKKVYQSLLYDFYGGLLKEHHRSIYEDYIFNDLSLSEIADYQNISRQGVHDIIKRTTNQLVKYEADLHLVEKYSKIKECIKQGLESTESLNKILKDNKDLKDIQDIFHMIDDMI
jgi:predicted DNA-binding protein YlxM (UPF0122 family)